MKIFQLWDAIGRASVVSLVLCSLWGMGALSPAMAQTDAAHCHRASIKRLMDDAFKRDKARIKTIQGHLNRILSVAEIRKIQRHRKVRKALIIDGKIRQDGIIGIETSLALETICKAFAIEKTKTFARDFAQILDHFAEVASVHPDWKPTLLSTAFETWINHQSASEQVTIYKIRRSGTARQIIDLLNVYHDAMQGKMHGTGTSKTEAHIKEYMVSYQITEEDIETIEEVLSQPNLGQHDNGKAFVNNLKQLEGKQFNNQTIFKEKITEIVKEIDEKPNPFAALVLEKSIKAKTYKLSKKSLNRILSDMIITEDRENLSEEDRDTIVEAIKQHANNQEFIEIIDKIIERLDDLIDETYYIKESLEYIDSKEETLEDAIRSRLEIVAKQYAVEDQKDDFMKLMGQNMPKDLLEKIQEGMQKRESKADTSQKFIDTYAHFLVEQYAESGDVIILTKEAIDSVGSTISAHAELRSKEWTPTASISIGKALKKSKMLNRTYIYESQFRDDLRDILGEHQDGIIETIVWHTKKEHRYTSLTNINWQDASCGCSDYPSEVYYVPAGSDHGVYKKPVIYGFYPFWMPQEHIDKKKDEVEESNSSANEEDEKGTEAEPAETLDFSLFTRIGYFAVPFDLEGNLFAKLHWRNDEASAFINRARTYQNQVDLIIYNDQWTKGGRLSTRVLVELTEQITALVTDRLTNSQLNRSMPYVSLGNKPVPTIGDGITIYFDPTRDQGELAYINVKNFIFHLAGVLEKHKKNHHRHKKIALNIMMPMHIFKSEGELGKTHFNFIEDIQNNVDHFLIFLHEPTTDTKKELRKNVEKLFKGEQRRRLLRRIVPVINTTGHEADDYHQFRDDMIYFHDNFGGVGLWPIPVSTANGMAGVESLVNIVKDEFQKRDANDTLHKTMQQWCTRYACPWRWTLRIIWNVAVLLCLTYAILSIWILALQAFIKRWVWVIGLVLLLLMVLTYGLVWCGLLWTIIRDYSFIFVILMASLLGLWMLARNSKRTEYP